MKQRWSDDGTGGTSGYKFGTVGAAVHGRIGAVVPCVGMAAAARRRRRAEVQKNERELFLWCSCSRGAV